MASWEADLDDDGLGSVERRADEAGLVSRVSAASFQVSKATEGLEQVAGLLRTAEEFAKDADTERREAEEALELVETQRAELSEMLALARSEAAAAEQRAVAAEERLKALEWTFALEARLDDGPRAEPVAGVPRQLTELRRRLMTSIMGLTLAMKHADPSSTNGATMIEEVGASAQRLERLLVQLIELDGIADGSFVLNQRRVVADTTAIGSAAERTVTEELRELSSFDDLSDEVAT
jgi:chromosome segregation ATPase